MTKVLQQIKSLKVTTTQIQASSRIQGQSWENVAKEKRTISKPTSVELVMGIGRAEVIGACKMANGQVKVYFTGIETKERMETHKNWTRKPAATTQIAAPTYKVKPEHLKRILTANGMYIMGIRIEKAAWLKKKKHPEKKAESLIVWFDQAENANKAISKRVIYNVSHLPPGPPKNPHLRRHPLN
ncbi:hypothetical protein K3495_g7732 [Podosphaera aphanis]|nr:hypothetical protein K3495_g7732 [Podosphaera aphanis]